MFGPPIHEPPEPSAEFTGSGNFPLPPINDPEDPNEVRANQIELIRQLDIVEKTYAAENLIGIDEKSRGERMKVMYAKVPGMADHTEAMRETKRGELEKVTDTALDRITELFKTGDTHKLLQTLEERLGIASAKKKAGEEDLDKLTKDIKATESAQDSSRMALEEARAIAVSIGEQATRETKAGAVYQAIHDHRRKTLQSKMNKQQRTQGKIGYFPEDLEEFIEHTSQNRFDSLREQDALREEIENLLSSWGFGNKPSDPDIALHMNFLFEEWTTKLSEMSPKDSLRATLARQWVQLAVRFQQRQIYTGDTTGVDPTFMPDRGVLLVTALGTSVLHEDGSITSITSTGSTLRSNTDGSQWKAPKNKDGSLHYANLVELNDSDLENKFNEEMIAWETERTLDSEVNAAAVTRAFSERLEPVVSSCVQELENLEGRIDQVSNELNAAHRALASKIAALPDPTDAKEVHRLRQEADQRLKDLQERVDRLNDDKDEATRHLEDARARYNVVEYWRGFMASTRPDEALGGNNQSVRLHKDGVIEWNRRRELNGVTGKWQISADGKSRVRLDNGTIVNYDRFGRVL